MKQAKIISMSASDPTRATVEFTHDDDTVTTVSDLGPIPLNDSDAAYRWLASYEAAYTRGISRVPAMRGPGAVAPAPVQVGILTPQV